MKVLMVLTSHDQLGNTGRKTGFWLEEMAAPADTGCMPAPDSNWLSRALSWRPGGGQDPDKLEHCAACGKDYVNPVDWEPVTPESWWMTLVSHSRPAAPVHDPEGPAAPADRADPAGGIGVGPKPSAA